MTNEELKALNEATSTKEYERLLNEFKGRCTIKLGAGESSAILKASEHGISSLDEVEMARLRVVIEKLKDSI